MSNLISIAKGRAIVSLNPVVEDNRERGSSGSFNVPVKKRGELTSALQTNFSRRWIIVYPRFTLSFPLPTFHGSGKSSFLDSYNVGGSPRSPTCVSFALEPFWLNFWPINLHQDIFQELPTPVYLKIGEVFFFTPLSPSPEKKRPRARVSLVDVTLEFFTIKYRTQENFVSDNFVSPLYLALLLFRKRQWKIIRKSCYVYYITLMFFPL